ncbi:MAG: anti-sigma factor [Saprospiraceae bacterium]|nr:anti-sigma factor [Saprospiraceae bacterium]
MDQLEKFIHEHRNRFDDRSPDPALWSAIEARLPGQEKRRVVMWKWVAAAAVGLVLILSGVIAGLSINHPDFMDTAEYQEFREAEHYYSVQLSDRLTQLSNYEYDPAIDTDIRELNTIYEELTAELLRGVHPDKNQVIEALIQNYQTRIELLERVLRRMDQGNQRMQTNNDEETTKI